jgi:hemerythrin-like domain-containing protein
MQARGLLMIEHRLIERMVRLMAERLTFIRRAGDIDSLFIETAVDFLRTYADRTHHGKEEDIMFLALEKRQLSPEDGKVMGELVHEHVLARERTNALVFANGRYAKGDIGAFSNITEALQSLIDFYPGHIAKEDKVFFPAARRYFTDEEDQAMLCAFWEFDRKMIHEKYRVLVAGFETVPRSPL